MPVRLLQKYIDSAEFTELLVYRGLKGWPQDRDPLAPAPQIKKKQTQRDIVRQLKARRNGKNRRT